MKYASIDLETTGLDRERCEVVEIAIVIEDTEQRVAVYGDDHQLPCVYGDDHQLPGPQRLPDVRDLPTFTRLVYPNHTAVWEVEAVDMHQKNGLLAALRTSASRPELVWAEAATFLTDALGPGRGAERWVVAGKNFNGFDRHFLPKHLEPRFHQRTLDPGALFVDWSKPTPPSLGDLLKRFGFDADVTHRALGDARDVIRVLRQGYAR